MEFTVKTSQEVYDLEASVRFIGKDLLVALWGGERPHVGAVAIAQPRPSLKVPERVSATTSVVCLLGHKEDDLAKAVAEILAAAMNTTVVVTAGIHWDNLDAEGIRKVLRNSEILVDLILEKIGRLSAHT
jgi:gallate decarboxylase subunit D